MNQVSSFSTLHGQTLHYVVDLFLRYRLTETLLTYLPTYLCRYNKCFHLETWLLLSVQICYSHGSRPEQQLRTWNRPMHLCIILHLSSTSMALLSNKLQLEKKMWFTCNDVLTFQCRNLRKHSSILNNSKYFKWMMKVLPSPLSDNLNVTICVLFECLITIRCSIQCMKTSAEERDCVLERWGNWIVIDQYPWWTFPCIPGNCAPGKFCCNL